MAANKEARLTLKLVDHVTGPARAVSTALTSMNKVIHGINTAVLGPSRVLQNAGRNLRQQTTNITATSGAVALGLGKAGQAIYDFEKAGNKMQAFGLLNEEQRKNLEEYAQLLNKDFPFTNKNIIQAAQELFRAGLTYEQAMASLKGTLQLAMSGDIDVKQATDIATNIMTAMRLPMETMEQVTASMAKVNDALAYAATNSNTDVKLMGDTFRYVAPLAAAAGISLEEVTAISMELAKAGIKGSEAGVAMRSSLVRMVKPTKPMLAALEAMNIDINDFVSGAKEISSDQVIKSLRGFGFETEDLKSKIDAVLGDKTRFNSSARLLTGLTDLIVESIGDETTREEVSDAIAQTILGGAERVDLFGLLKTLREKGAGTGDIARIFDVRMGSRLAAVLHTDLDAALQKVYREYEGVGAKMSGLMMSGIVGEVARLIAAMENMAIAMANSGVLTTVGETMDKFSNFITELSKTDPQLLEAFTYSLMGLATLGPAGLALSGIASALGLMVNPIVIIGGAAGYLAYQNMDKLSVVADKAWGILKSIGESKFVEGFLRGAGEASHFLADGLTTAVDALDKLLSQGGRLKEWLNSSVGEGWGEALGKWSVYLAAIAAAAGGLGLVAKPILAIGNAVLALSGIKLAWPLLRFLTGLGKAGVGLAATAAGINSVSSAIKASSILRGAIGTALGLNLMPADEKEAQEMINRGKARSDRWNQWLEENIGTPRSWLGLDEVGSGSTARDYTLGSSGGFRPEGRAPQAGKILHNGLGFRRSDDATSRLPSGASPIAAGMAFSAAGKGGDNIKNIKNDVSVVINAPISVTTTDANVGSTIASELDKRLRRSAETTFGGSKPYGDM